MSNDNFGYNDAMYENWIMKLSASFWKIRSEVERHTDRYLKEPHFTISPMNNKKWGHWNAGKREIWISEKLLRNFEWEAVEYVLKHEVAHMVVSEVFDMDCYGVSHGAAFAKACDVVGIPNKRCCDCTFLSEFKGNGDASPVVEKVRKLMIKGNDDGATEVEQELFMTKAREIMMRHDIEMTQVMGTEKVFVTRPFGDNHKRWPNYMWNLGTLLSDEYNVRCIKTYGPNRTSRLELFGEPSNLDIAEYVGHALLNQAEVLYNKHKKEVAKTRAAERKEEKELYGYVSSIRRGKLSKRAYMEGLISGYSQKLTETREAAKSKVEESVAQENAKASGGAYSEGDRVLVPTYDKELLKEMYGNAYPNMRTTKSSGSYGSGYGSGSNAGKSLTLGKGVGSSGSGGTKLLG